jgi:hypothetical protein
VEVRLNVRGSRNIDVVAYDVLDSAVKVGISGPVEVSTRGCRRFFRLPQPLLVFEDR